MISQSKVMVSTFLINGGIMVMVSTFLINGGIMVRIFLH